MGLPLGAAVSQPAPLALGGPCRGRRLGSPRFSLFRSQQPSSQRTWQLKKSKEAHGKVAISWPEVEEVRAATELR